MNASDYNLSTGGNISLIYTDCSSSTVGSTFSPTAYQYATCECNPLYNSPWEIANNVLCDQTDAQTGSGNVQITSGSTLLINNSNVTTTSVAVVDEKIVIQNGKLIIS